MQQSKQSIHINHHLQGDTSMKTTLCWFTLALVIGPFWQSGLAGTVLGTEGQKVYPRTTGANTQGDNTLRIYGDWIENIDRATAPAGVTVNITRKLNGAQNNTGSFAGRGMVILNILTNNATPGDKTIRLIDDPILGVGGSTFTITITVMPPPTVTSVTMPTPADPFKEIVVTFSGTGLQGAKDEPLRKIVKDNLVNYITVGRDVMVSSVRVLSSSNATLQVKIFFNGFVQDVSVDMTFSTTYNNPVPLVNGLTRRVRVRSSNVKNYVKSITFPNGDTFDRNSIATIRLNLLFPAPPDGSTTIGAGERQIPVNLSLGNANRKVFFKLVPENAFAAVANGTPLNASGLTTVLATVGDNVIQLTFKVADCLGGQPGQTNVVKIQTWMHNTNTTLEPEFVEQTFKVRCTQ
jgi:hypothetical protein